MTTKEAIVYESLKLFSVNGFDSVSTRMIAGAVNLSNAVIYKHFRSKREILDTIIEECTKKLFSRMKEINLESVMNWKDIEKICLDMFKFQTTDEWTVMFRKLLIIEQYKNPEFLALYKKIFIDTALSNMMKIFKSLMEKGYMKKGNPGVYAMELYAPFFMYHMFGQSSEETLEKLEEHVVNFRKNVISDPNLLELDDKSKKYI